MILNSFKVKKNTQFEITTFKSHDSVLEINEKKWPTTKQSNNFVTISTTWQKDSHQVSLADRCTYREVRCAVETKKRRKAAASVQD